MKASPYPSQQTAQFKLRLPTELRDRIKRAGKANRRTMNSEVVHCLQSAYPDEQRVMDRRAGIEEQVRAIKDRIDQEFLRIKEALDSFRAAPEAEDNPGGSSVSRTPVGSPKWVTIRELAERLQMDRSACRRYVLSLGYAPTKQRTVSSGYQPALTVTQAEAREIQSKRAAEGYCDPPS